MPEAEARHSGDATRATAEGLVSVQSLGGSVEALGHVLRGETLVKLPPQRFLDLLTSMLHGSYADTEMFPFDPSPVAQGKSHVPIGVLKQWWGAARRLRQHRCGGGVFGNIIQ